MTTQIWRRSEADFIEPSGHFGGLVVSDVVEEADGSGLTVQESHAPAGGGGEMHRHEGHAQLFFVVEGQLSFDTGSDRFTLGAGEAVLFLPGEPHATLNEGLAESISLVVTVAVPGI